MDTVWRAYKPIEKEVVARRLESAEVVTTYNCEAVIAEAGMYVVVDDGQTMVMKANKFNNKYQRVENEELRIRVC